MGEKLTHKTVIQSGIVKLAAAKKAVADFENSEAYELYKQSKSDVKDYEDMVRHAAMLAHLETDEKLLHPAVKIQSRKSYDYDERVIYDVLELRHTLTDDSYIAALRVGKKHMDAVIKQVLETHSDYLELNPAVLKKQMAKGNEWLDGLYKIITEPYVVVAKDLSEFVDSD